MKKIDNLEKINGGGWGCFFAGLGCGASIAAAVLVGWTPAVVIPAVRAVAACGGAIYVCG